MAALHIHLDDLSDPRIAQFLQEHLSDMRRISPPESVHALDLEALRRPEIRFWTAWQSQHDGVDDVLVGTAALKHLDARHAELKSMRTASALRGQGHSRTLLRFVVEQACVLGVQRLSLETGSQEFFVPARTLYQSEGFEPCGPFGGYGPDPNSCFFTRLL